MVKSMNNRKERMPSLSVFFPCYNEEGSIEALVNNSLAVLEEIGSDYEVIIVNDGSSDSTGSIVNAIATSNKRVKAVHHLKNKGYGAALQSGFKASMKEVVFYTDGDGQFNIGEMPKLLPLIKKYDIVSCYRKKRQDPIIRKLKGFCWTALVNILLGMNVRDIGCAFKMYKRRVFDDMKMTSTGALIDAEILARALHKGYTIVQRPVTHYPRKAGERSGASIAVIFRTFKELFALQSKIRKGE